VDRDLFGERVAGADLASDPDPASTDSSTAATDTHSTTYHLVSDAATDFDFHAHADTTDIYLHAGALSYSHWRAFHRPMDWRSARHIRLPC